MPAKVHPVQIYYEDTDFSGVVYHANYLKYFERAREHLLGVEALVDLYRDEGVGFVVYKAELTFKAGATHGDQLQIHTSVRVESAYRLLFHQQARRQHPAPESLLVDGRIQLACVGRDQKLVRVPTTIVKAIQERFGTPSSEPG